ncbi:MAG TPA: cyclic pyranopterin monophosphate synthase MoaC [Planctomycetota bacterium]|jgi:cyclic pyranopterin phosphate synthase|nr:cyclic pyranopterin monophosphate synthase MoaC [Planctomycetota bacterium]
MTDQEERELGHLRPGPEGPESRMVDVSAKTPSQREALAGARVRFPAGVLERVLREGGPKGPITEVARTAGILAAKRTAELIPMCHPLGLDLVDVRFERADEDPDLLLIRCRAVCSGRTGVEMECLVGAGIAALTVIDMTKALSPAIAVEELRLLEKRGGKSGPWLADPGS